VEVEATPPLDDREHRALISALEQFELGICTDEPYRHAWRLAALSEAALGDDVEVGYAFSPRSTRGATRA
jgi:hypothetical protein